MHRVKVAALAIGTILLPGGFLIPIAYTIIRRVMRQRKASMTT